jgi:hypothetical protein
VIIQPMRRRVKARFPLGTQNAFIPRLIHLSHHEKQLALIAVALLWSLDFRPRSLRLPWALPACIGPGQNGSARAK